MVDVEFKIGKVEDGSEKVSSGDFDVNEIVGKVRGFVEGLKETSVGGRKMKVSVDGFEFSVGQSEGKFDLRVGVSLGFTPKKPAEEPVP